MQRQQAQGELLAQEHLLTHKSPVHGPLKEELPRKLESLGKVASWGLAQKRCPEEELNLCHYQGLTQGLATTEGL